jgi:hypothetical protein
VNFDLDDQRAQELGIDAGGIESQLGGRISEDLGLADPAGYLSSFANADAMAMKGMGVDYATNPKKFSVGGALGSAVSGVPLSFARGQEELPEGGFAFMASVYGGINLGMLVPGKDGLLNRISLYVNGLAFSPPGNREFRASMYNFGAHAQLKLIGPVNLKVVEWGGLDLTSGYERSFYRLELSRALPLTQSVDGGEVTWTATGTYAIEAGAGAIPIELSTNLRVLVATAYLGGALDLNTANAASRASLTGPVDAVAAGQAADIGTIGVDLDGDAVADPLVGRVFVGLQANVLMLKVFGHLNLGLNETYGGFLGARIAM